MELRSLEGYPLLSGLSGLADAPLNIVAHTLDERTGVLVCFDDQGNMYGMDVVTGAMQLLLKAMLPLGIGRIMREPDGRIIGYTASGGIQGFSNSELGFLRKAFDKVGAAIKKTADKIGDTTVGKVLRVVATPVLAPAMVAQSLIKGESLKQAVSDSTSRLKEDAKATGDLFGKVIRFVNRFVNPATILLRNGWLVSMKINLFGLAATLRWGYAPSYQYAFERTGMSPADFERVKEQVRKIEVIYWQSGGMEENMKKAILNGKGNRDGQVPRGDGQLATANDAIEAQTFLNEYDDAGNLIGRTATVSADGTIVASPPATSIPRLPTPMLPAASVADIRSQAAAQAAYAAKMANPLLSRMSAFQSGQFQSGQLRGLGVVAESATAVVSSAVAAVAAFLKPITDLISQGKKAVTDVTDLLPKKQGDIPEIPPIAPNGITPQGITPQGITPQGITPQGITPQGYAPQNAAPGNLPAPIAPPADNAPFYKSTPFLVGAGVLAAGGIATAVVMSTRHGGQARKDAPRQAKRLSGLSAVAGLSGLSANRRSPARKPATAQNSSQRRKVSQLGLVPLT